MNDNRKQVEEFEDEKTPTLSQESMEALMESLRSAPQDLSIRPSTTGNYAQ